MAEVVSNEMAAVVPPFDIEAEKAVLGSMMKDADAVSDVIDVLKADDFYEKAHQEIYRIMLDLYRKSIGIDIMTTYSALTELKLAELVGGMTYLSKLVNDAIVSSNAKYYADTVVAKARMRGLIKAADQIKSKAYEGGNQAEEVLDFAEQRIFEIAHRSQKRAYRDINEVFVDNFKIMQELERNKGQLPGITTGFRDVDNILGGLHKTDLVILAARPGMGKTAFALNVATNAAKAGHSVIVFSMEMPDVQLGTRILATAASVDMKNIKNGTLSQDEWFALSEAQDSFEDVNLTVDETSNISILEMKNKCRRLKAEKGLDLIVIDYLQLMDLGGTSENRVQEIAKITRNIKIMAKELDCAIVLLSQLSRKAAEEKHIPQLSDLRDSGAIEQDADVVIFLNREDYWRKNDEPADINPNVGTTCDVYIAKHRNGETGKCTLAWVGKYTKFGNLASSSFERM